MIAKRILPLALGLFLCATTATPASESNTVGRAVPSTPQVSLLTPEAGALGTARPTLSSNPLPSPTAYVLSPNDLVLIKVYRHDDLETRLRIAKDGTSTFPLLGTVQLGGKTVEQATSYIREFLAQDYLVNPQVTLTVLEYAKRRFTVLGQVQKPGSYEIPSEESVSLLEAVAIAGGFTRLSNTGKISVSRLSGAKRTLVILDITTPNRDSEFQIQPDDTINVPQRIF